MPTYLSRRSFLQSLGIAAGVSQLIPLLEAHAQTTTVPKRLVLLFTPYGHLHQTWMPTGTPSSFTFGPGMAALAPFAKKINILDGVAMKGNGHELGQQQMWTGATKDSNAIFGQAVVPGATSVDQTVADFLGTQTAFRSLEFGVGQNCAQWASDNRQSWRNGNAQEPEQSPQSALKRIFTGSSQSKLNENKSVLDVISKNLTSVRSKIGKADQYKIDAHMTAVRDLEQRFAVQAKACAAPVIQDDPVDDPNDIYGISNDTLTAAITDFYDIMAAAFACDATRVASMQTFASGAYGQYQYPGTFQENHGLTHASPSDTQDGNGNNTDYAHSVNGQLTTIDQYHAARVAAFLTKLDAIPEGNGTVLDNTLIVWSSELAQSSVTTGHACGSPGGSQFMTMGGGGSIGLKTGRWLQYPTTQDYNSDAPPTEHNRLLVSMANYMGLTNINKYGQSDLGSGPLPNF